MSELESLYKQKGKYKYVGSQTLDKKIDAKRKQIMMVCWFGKFCWFVEGIDVMLCLFVEDD